MALDLTSAAVLGQVTADSAPPRLRAGVGLPILNEAAFEETTGFLNPDLTRVHLQILDECIQSLLAALVAPDSVARNGTALARPAHKLAGNAGMFGFEQLATVARQFEQAVKRGDPDAASLAADLAETIALTIAAVGDKRALGTSGGFVPAVPISPPP